MSSANIAYLILVLAAYAVFILVLGGIWVRSALERPQPAARTERRDVAAPKPGEAQPSRRKAA